MEQPPNFEHSKNVPLEVSRHIYLLSFSDVHMLVFDLNVPFRPFNTAIDIRLCVSFVLVMNHIVLVLQYSLTKVVHVVA